MEEPQVPIAERPSWLPAGLKLAPFCSHMAEPGNAYDLAKALRGPVMHIYREALAEHFARPRIERLMPDEYDLMQAIMTVLTEGFTEADDER